jgi:hypothetical protein
MPFQLCRGRLAGSSVETYTITSPVNDGLSLRNALGPLLSVLSLNGGGTAVSSSLIVRRIPWLLSTEQIFPRRSMHISER